MSLVFDLSVSTVCNLTGVLLLLTFLTFQIMASTTPVTIAMITSAITTATAVVTGTTSAGEELALVL